MPGSTDTRIVQMQFDNREFEKNIQTSEKSLERFKEELDFDKCEKSLVSFENATKNLTFDSMAENLQKLADKFTGLGTVSELVLSQIRRGIENVTSKISGMINSLGFEQVGEGLDKFAQMNKNVQTIMSATGRSEEEVYKVLGRLNEYTDQTSYNFTDMAANIGKFTSVGIKLEDAEKQMEGIANWAARSGAGITEASRAMYNLSQAMGVGKMTLIDWKSIENAGMATKEFKQQMIAAGLASGTLVSETNKAGETVYKTAAQFGKQMEVNFQNMGSTLSKGWANAEVIQKTLMDYYYEDLYYESEAVLDLTKDQLEQTKKLFEDHKLDAEDWKDLSNMGIMSDEVKQKAIDAAVKMNNLVKETTKDGKTIYKTAAKYGKQIEVSVDTIEKSLSVGWLDQSVARQIGLLENLGKSSYEAAQKCTTLTDVLGAWKDQLSTGWMKAWQKVFGDLTESMDLFSAICNKVGEGFSDMIATLVGGTDSAGDEITGILESWVSLGGRLNLWSLFVGEYDGLYEGAYGVLDILKDIGGMFKDAFIEVMSIFVPEDRKGLFKTDKNARNAWFGIQLNNITTTIRNFIQSIKNFFEEIPVGAAQSRGQMITNVIQGVISAFVIGYTVIRDIVDFVKGIASQLQPSIDAVLSLLATFGIGVQDAADKANKGGGLKLLFNDLLVSIKPLTDSINSLLVTVTTKIKEFFKKGQESGTFTKVWKTIVDVINIVAKVISKVAGPILDFVTELIDIVSDLFQNGFSSETLKSAGSRLEKAITGLFNGLFGLIPGIGNKLQEFIAYIFGFAEEDVNGESKTILGVLKQWLRKIFGGVADLVGSFKKELGGVTLFSIIKENLGIGLLAQFINGLAGIVKGTNLYGIIMAFLGGYALFKLIRLLKQGGGLFKSIKTFFSDAGSALKDGIKIGIAGKAETVGDKMLMIAKAMALIVASVAVLGSMRIENLIKGTVALVAIMAAFTGFVYILKRIAPKNLKEVISVIGIVAAVSAAIVSISIGISILILALKAFANMSMEGFLRATVGLMVVVGTLVLLAYALKALKVNSVKIAGIASLAIGIGLIIMALTPLAKTDWVGLAKMGAGLLVVLGMLVGFTALMKGLTMKGTGMGQIALLAIGIALMVNSFKGLADLKPEGLARVFSGLIVFLGAILVFVKLMEGMTMKGAGMGQLILLAAAIVILMESIKPLANIEWEQLGKMGAGLASVLLLLVLFTNGVSSMKGTGMMNVLFIAGAIWLLVQALLPLANMKWEALGKMAVALVVLGAVIVGMTHLIKPMNILEGAGVAIMLGGLALIFAAFALVMSSIKGVKWEQVFSACLWLSIILIIFGAITKYLIKTSNILEATSTLISLAGLAVVMIAFSIALNEIRNVPTDKILGFSVGLAAIIGVFAIAVKLLKDVPIVMALKVIAILGAGLLALALILSVAIPILLRAIGNSATELTAKISLIASLINDFSNKMSNVDESGIDKAGTLIDRLKEIFGKLIGFDAYTAGVNSFTTAVWSLATTLDIYQDHTANLMDPANSNAIKMINTLLSLKDRLVGFDSSDFTDSIYKLAVGLYAFDGAGANMGDIASSKPLALLKELAASAQDLKAFSQLSIDDLKREIAGLGGAMMIYAQGAKEATGLDIGEVPDVSGAMRILQEISSTFAKEGGFELPEVPSKNELGDFGTDLAALAGAITTFVKASDGIGIGTDNAIALLTFLSGDLKDRLTKSNLASVKAFEDTGLDPADLLTFSFEISALGMALSGFISSTQDLGNINGAMDALTFFAELRNKLTQNDFDTAFLNSFEGVEITTIETFGRQIEELGKSLAGFATSVTWGKEKEASFDNAMDALEFLVELENKLPDTGGVLSWIFGYNQTFTDLSGQLEVLGTALSGFAEKLNGENAILSTEKLGAAKATLMAVVEFMNYLSSSLPTVGGIGAFFSSLFNGSTYNLDNLKDDLGRLGTGLGAFSQNLGSDFKNKEELEGAVEIAKSVSEIIAIFSSLNPDSNYSVFKYMSDLGTFFNLMANGYDPEAYDYMYGYEQTAPLIDVIGSLMKKISDIVHKYGGIDPESINIFTQMAIGLNNLSKVDPAFDFKPIGENIASGVETGIKAGQSKVIAAAVNMAVEAYIAAKKALESNSPSKLFAQLGEYSAEGMALGMANKTGVVTAASAGMSLAAVNGAASIISTIASMMNEEDLNPTITPVLDLSNVQTGMNEIDKGFGDRKVGLNLTGVNQRAQDANSGWGSTQAQIQSTPDLTGVYDRMTILGNQIVEMGNQIQKMQIVLDSGALVGNVTNGVDANIGRKTFYATRRN